MKRTAEELEKLITEAKTKVPEGSYFYHYKNPDNDHKYVIRGIGVDQGTQELSVLYSGLYDELDSVIFIRPLTEFLETVTNEQGEEVPRFKRIETD
jgi:hypothetical protein